VTDADLEELEDTDGHWQSLPDYSCE
jgi:hypothetical protein